EGHRPEAELGDTEAAAADGRDAHHWSSIAEGSYRGETERASSMVRPSPAHARHAADVNPPDGAPPCPVSTCSADGQAAPSLSASLAGCSGRSPSWARCRPL